MQRIVTVVWALASAVCCVASPTLVVLAADPSPSLITINTVSTSGSGCPRDSVATTISNDRTVVTLGFDEYQTYIGPRPRRSRGRNGGDNGRGGGNNGGSFDRFRPADAVERDKNCNIRLNLNYPGGYTLAVVEVTYHGFAQLDPGVTGNFASSFSFGEGSSFRESSTRSSLSGSEWANGGVYTRHEQIPAEARVQSPCGTTGNLFIRTRISLASTNSSGSGALTDDDATIAFTQQVHVSWQKCTA